MLLDCGADVTVVSPTPHLEHGKVIEKKAIRLIHRNYKGGDLMVQPLLLQARM